MAYINGKPILFSAHIHSENGGIIPKGEIEITENGTHDVSTYASAKVNVPVSEVNIPVEIATEAEMNSLLESGTVGSVYKYTGTTGTYETGAYYMLEVSGDGT